MSLRDPMPHLVEVAVDPPFVHRVDVDALARCARETLALRGLRRARAVEVRVTDTRTLRRLNRRYRGKDEATDVLSFNTEFAGLSGGSGASELGTLVLALPVASRGARARGVSLAEELALLVVHGVLHLLGFDHETPSEDAEMRRLEARALERAGYGGASRETAPYDT